MALGFAVRMRRGPVAPLRLLAGVTAASLLVFSLPSPADAAPTPSVTISDVTATEGTGAPTMASFMIQAAPPPKVCCPLQVSWAAAPGSASAPGDFTPSSGTVSLTRSSTSKVVSVPIIGDDTDEANETFVVNLTTLVGSPGRFGDSQGVGTITDNDAPPTLSVNEVSVAEGNAGTVTAAFTASLSAVSGKSVTFDWATAPGSAAAGVDFVTAGGSRTIAAGATIATIAVTVNGDVVDEVDETYTVTLSNPGNATIGDGSGLGTITDDDPLPLVAVDDASLVEGNVGTTEATFDVTLSSASSKTVTVDWATADDSAAQPDDYTAASGTLTFVPGDTSETVVVLVNGDITPELQEIFHVDLSAQSNADLGDAVGVGTIDDDELMPVIDIDDPAVPEGQSGTNSVTFSVTLSNPSASTVTVDWTTAAGTAESGIDHVDATGTVTFAPLDTSETVEVTVNGDGTYERNETLSLDLSNATGAPIGDPRGVGTIANDDAAPTLSVSNVSGLEGNSGQSALSFAVSLTGDTDVDASVEFATADITATAATDYLAAAGTLTIPAGETGATIDVVVNGDTTYESNQTLSVTLSDPTDAVVADGVAAGTIRNDDKSPTTVTLRVSKKPRELVARGILEPGKAGFRVTAKLFRSRDGRFVKVAAKTVRVRYLRDRDGDGRRDGSYKATFLRPMPKGTYEILVRFRGTATHRPCGRARVFTLAAT